MHGRQYNALRRNRGISSDRSDSRKSLPPAPTIASLLRSLSGPDRFRVPPTESRV